MYEFESQSWIKMANFTDFTVCRLNHIVQMVLVDHNNPNLLESYGSYLSIGSVKIKLPSEFRQAVIENRFFFFSAIRDWEVLAASSPTTSKLIKAI